MEQKNATSLPPLYMLYGTAVPNVRSLNWDVILDKFPRPSAGRGRRVRSLVGAELNLLYKDQLDAFDPSKFVAAERPVPGQFDDPPHRRKHRHVKPAQNRVSQSNVICPVDTQEVNQVDPGEEADDSASDSSDSQSALLELAQRKLQRISLALGPVA